MKLRKKITQIFAVKNQGAALFKNAPYQHMKLVSEKNLCLNAVIKLLSIA